MTGIALRARPVRVIALAATHAFLSSVAAAIVGLILSLPLGYAYGFLTGTIPSERLMTVVVMVVTIPLVWIGVQLSLIVMRRWGPLCAIRGFALISTALLIVGSIIDVSLDLFGLYQELSLFDILLPVFLFIAAFFLITRRYTS